MNPPDGATQMMHTRKTSHENEWAGYSRELSQLVGNQLLFLNSITTRPESHGFNPMVS